jgi:NADPH-dependent 2,4-dienoyl-CoA reductase/sulfur reductase-like enzyme
VWRVERKGDMVVVWEKATPAQTARSPAALPMPKSILILGGGAAGNMAAETLRREGYAGKIVMLSADASIPYDRSNLSKDYLSGDAPDDWIPLRSPEFYKEHGIELHLGASATMKDPAQRTVDAESGSRFTYDALLIACGAVLLEYALRYPHSYVGYAKDWDSIEIDGDIKARDCRANHRRAGRTLAVANDRTIR